MSSGAPGVVKERACRGCGAELPPPFLDLGETPLANAYLPADAPPGAGDPRYPLAVTVCGACHLVQLVHTVPPAAMFSDYAYFSSYSDAFLAHAAAMARSLCRDLDLEPGSRVLEIASNDGYLLKHFAAAGLRTLGVEPAENVAAVARAAGVDTLCAFFGPAAVGPVLDRLGAAHLVVGNNVLAHVPEINGFLAAVRAVLAADGVAVFEVPYLRDFVAHLEFDTVYHEHVFYFSVAALQALGARAGLALVDVQWQPVHGGTIRTFFSPESGAVPGLRVERAIAAEARLGLLSPDGLASFGQRVDRLKGQLKALLEDLAAGGASLAAYGAPAKGNTLLNACGIDRSLIPFAVDRSPHKQGRLLPGSRIPVLPPEALLERHPDYALLLAWNWRDEVLAQQQAWVARGGRFIVPLPTPTVVPAP